MRYPDTRKPYRLYTDACAYAVGAILVQMDNEGVERPVHYISHQLNTIQQRWATIEKEAFAVVYALQKLRPYLYGAEFVVLTDHKPLKSLFQKEIQNSKIQRWAVLLAEYGAKIEYRQGKHNVRADMLSRIRVPEVAVITGNQAEPTDNDIADVNVLTADNIDKNELCHLQRLEFAPELERAADDDGDLDYSMENGILVSDALPYSGAQYYPRIVLPQKYRRAIIEVAHQEVGHMSTSKTMKRVTESYVWTGLRKDVKQYISQCPTCQAHHRRIHHVEMGDIEVPTGPMQTLGVDFIGPFTPADRHGRKYVLTVIDHHSGWAEAFPALNQSADELTRIMTEELFPRHGQPRVIICDNGQGLGSRAWAKFLADANIELRRTTPVHPQANGKTERLNRTLKEILETVVNNKPEQWPTGINAALAAHRIAVSDVTGYSPFQLLYGRQPRVPLERYLAADTHFGSRLDDLAEAYKQAKKNTEDSRKYNRQRLAARANVATSLQVGDTVTVKAEERVTNTTRWDPRFTVIRVRGTTHWIRHEDTAVERKLHREKLTLVDPAIVWDDLPPRPRRVFRPRN